MKRIFAALCCASLLVCVTPEAGAQEEVSESQIAEFRQHIDDGTIQQFLQDNPDMKSYLSDLRRVSDSGELNDAMQANPNTRQQLLDAGIITEDNVISPVLAELIPAQSTLDEQEQSTTTPPVASEFTRETSSDTPGIIYPTEVPPTPAASPVTPAPSTTAPTSQSVFAAIIIFTVALLLSGALWWRTGRSQQD